MKEIAHATYSILNAGDWGSPTLRIDLEEKGGNKHDYDLTYVQNIRSVIISSSTDVIGLKSVQITDIFDIIFLSKIIKSILYDMSVQKDFIFKPGDEMIKAFGSAIIKAANASRDAMIKQQNSGAFEKPKGWRSCWKDG